MEKKIKWGVLGYARIAKTSVIPAILRAGNSEFYAIASRNEASLAECRQEFGCAKVYLDYLALLKDPEIDAVYIPLPNSLHRGWAITAAQHGKHILCEKPLALNSGEVSEMIAAARDNGVLLMEAFMYRYTDRMKKVQELLAQGVIGRIKFIQSSFRFFLDRPNTIKIRRELGGGSLYDVGCYPVNFVGMITGKEPVSCSVEMVMENGVDTIFSAVLKYDDGVIATINSGFNAFGRNYSEIIGDLGVLEIPDTFLGNAGTIRLIRKDGVEEIPVAESDRYALEVEDFAQAILEGRQPYFTQGETVRNMRVIERLLEGMRHEA